MSQQNRQWALPSKPGSSGRRRKKKASTPVTTSTNTNSSFSAAKSMFENNNTKPTNKNTSNTHVKKTNSFSDARSMFQSNNNNINIPSKPKPKPKSKPPKPAPSQPIQSQNPKPIPNNNIPPNNNNKPPPQHPQQPQPPPANDNNNITDDNKQWYDYKNLMSSLPSVISEVDEEKIKQKASQMSIGSLADLQQLANANNNDNDNNNMAIIDENIEQKQDQNAPISSPSNIENAKPIIMQPQGPSNQQNNNINRGNNNVNRSNNNNMRMNQQNGNNNNNNMRGNGSNHQYSNSNHTQSNNQYINNRNNNAHNRNNSSGFGYRNNNNNNMRRNMGNNQYNNNPNQYNNNNNNNQNQYNNQYNNRGNVQYNNNNNNNNQYRNNYNQRGNYNNQNRYNNNVNNNYNRNNQHNRGNSNFNNNNVNNNYNRNNQHNRGNSNFNNGHNRHNSNYNNHQRVNSKPQNNPVTHSRANTTGFDNNIQWNYSGSKTNINDINDNNNNPSHNRNQSQSQSQSHSRSDTHNVMSNNNNNPKQPVNDNEWWYYVDPHKEKVSDRMYNKYELKDMFVNKYINEHCLVWNDYHNDYVTINEVPHLLNFFYDDTSDRRKTKRKPPPIPKHISTKPSQNQGQKHNKSLSVVNDGNMDNPSNWETLFTADGKPYYKNLINQQIVWSKPRCLRGSMKIMINNESIRNIKAGIAIPKEKERISKPVPQKVIKPKANIASPKPVVQKAKPKISSPKLTGMKGPQKRMSKKELKELEDFKETENDVRWIPHSKDGFVIAQFVKRDGKYSIYQPFDDSDLFQSEVSNDSKKKVKRKAIKIPTLKVKNDGLKITNWEYMDKNVANMVELPLLSTPYVLHNLKHRFLNHQIYTQVGDIMISINPYQLLPLYLPSVLEDYKYQRMDANALPPHIYDIARKCYNNIIGYNRAQSIIISGESGSGKTECTKQILQFIAECAGNDNKIEQKLLSTNPILESFGNCRTVRNNNSSRFGKYIEIFFNNSNQIIQSNNNQIIKSFQTIYMLEKVRVCKKSKEERNYHIFYQLIKCNDDKLKKVLKLGKVSNYAYLQGVETAPGINDSDDFIHLNKAFKDIGCFADERDKNTVFNIYKLCSAILWIGNIIFEDDSMNNMKGHSCKISVKSNNALKVICNLLEIANVNDLTEALMYKSVQFGGKNSDNSQNNEITKIGLSVNKAFENRDALAKFLYNELFTWIVNKLNEFLIDKTLIKHDNDRIGINFGYEEDDEKKEDINNNYRIMGVLDIFGFEILENNSFEQLCINYTNERLQYQFDQTVFRNEENLYKREGVQFNIFDKFNNLTIIELIDKKKTGMFSILDAQSSVPNSNDTTFMITLNNIHDIPSQSKIYEKYAKKVNNFIIHHYAGKVQYDARGFINKNRDSLNSDLLKLLDKSRMELITNVIGATIRENLTNKKLNKTKLSLSKLYVKSLNVLINKLSYTETSYIRCIKPNDIKKKNCWMGKLVLDQLNYSGIFEAIKVQKNGYPFRGLHKEFIDRFKLMVSNRNKLNNTNIIQCAEQMKCDLLPAGGANSNFVIGKTMVFYQQKEHEILEKKRKLTLNSHVCLIQNTYRMYIERKDFKLMCELKPRLLEAIRTRNINLLNAVISDSINISFELNLIINAKELRQLIIKEQQCEEHIKYILNNKQKLTQYVQDLSRALAEADEINYYSPTVQHARQTLEQFTSHGKIRKKLQNAIKEFDIEQIKHALEMANFANIPQNDPLIIEAKNTLKFVDEEKDLLIQLQNAFDSGGYLKHGSTIDYSFAYTLDIDGLTDMVTKCHKFQLKTKYGKNLLKKARHIMQLRIALKKALIGRNNNELWNIVVNVINNSILKDMPNEMTENREVIAANQVIYIYFRDNFSEKFAETLRIAIERMDYNLIKMKLSELYSTKQYELNSKYNGLVARAKELIIEMECINNYLNRGLQEKNMNLLSIGINKCNDIGYVNNELFKTAHLFYTQYGTFDVRLNKAISEFDIDEMKLLLDESQQYENKRNDSKIIQIKQLIYNTSFEKLLQLQLNAAVSQRDPEKVCKITLKLKKLFFEKNGNKFNWKLYPLLLTPDAWAKTGSIFMKKNKLKKTFYVWTNNPIHHSLTDLNNKSHNTKMKNSNNNNIYLKKLSCEMFKNIMGIMGDRHYQQPLSLIQDILIKIQSFIPLRNEFFAQIIKQLTNNPSNDSKIKGWNLLTVVLDTLKPPKDIENYLEKWLRDNKNPYISDKEFYVRLLHQTIFLGSRPKIPPLPAIELLMNGKGIRSLKNNNNNNNEKDKEKQPPTPIPIFIQKSQSKSNEYEYESKANQQIYNNNNNGNNSNNNPPKLTSVHEGKLQQQRMTLQWQRTVDKMNKFEQQNSNNNNNNNNNNNKQPGMGTDNDYEFRNKIYYCGYTMDDERRKGNNFHYAPHPKRNKNNKIVRQPGAIHGHQPGQPIRNVPNSTTDPIKDYNNILDL